MIDAQARPPAAVADVSSACLLLFAKAPVPGRVKTRLLPLLSPLQAATLQAAFVDDLVTRLAGSSAFALRLAWALEEGEPLPVSAVTAVRQRGADLGERLHGALADAARQHELVAAIGSDYPQLSRQGVEEAFAHLAAGVDVVLGPAADGGYYLVGVRARALCPRLFGGIPWSTPAVLAATLQRCEQLSLRVALLPSAADVDTPADLAHLAQALQQAGSADCPATAALLAAWAAAPPAFIA